MLKRRDRPMRNRSKVGMTGERKELCRDRAVWRECRGKAVRGVQLDRPGSLMWHDRTGRLM